MSTKTYAQLGVQTGIEATDLIATWRSVGPLKTNVVSDFTSYLAGFYAPLAGATFTGAVDFDLPIQVGTATSSGDDSAILIARTITTQPATGSHGVRDESTINTAAGLKAYAAFDAIPVMSGTAAYDHLRGFQARPTYSGSNTVAGMDGVYVSNVVSGSGTAVYSTGLHVEDFSGGGTVTTNYGVYVGTLVNGDQNFPFYSIDRNLSYFAGQIQTSLGLIAAPVLTGNLSDTFGLQVQNVTLSGHTLTTQYGLRVEPLSGATSNFGVWVEGNNQSNFRGQVQVGHTLYSLFVADADEDAYGVHIVDANANAHTIGTQFGLFIEDLTTGGTNIAISSQGTAIWDAGGRIQSAVRVDAPTMRFTSLTGSPGQVVRVDTNGQTEGSSLVITGNIVSMASNGALTLSQVTTTQRDALTAVNGMLVYNTTLNKFQGYENGAWVNLI